MNKPKALILSERTFHNAPRIIREIAALRDVFDIQTIGRSAPSDQSIPFQPIEDFIPFANKAWNKIFRELYYRKVCSFFAEYYPLLERYIQKEAIDVVIIHEPGFLPMMKRLKKKRPIQLIYNAHEYHPLEFEEKPGWLAGVGRYQYSLYQRYLKVCDLMLNVCEGIRLKCLEEFGMDSLTIPNAAACQSFTPVLHREGPFRMIYHGGIMRSRGIEHMIRLCTLLGEGFTLDIMGTVPKNDRAYFDEIMHLIEQTPNVHFRPAVDFDQIIPTIREYDIGLYILQPVNFNNRHALPNKFFEYIQARLALAIAPSPEMKRICEQYHLGVVATDFTPESLAASLKSLTSEQVNIYKQNAHQAAAIEHAEHYELLYRRAVLNLWKKEQVTLQ